jgi:hypothetical protein
VLPSGKAIAREREELRKMTDVHQSLTPLPELVARLNRQSGRLGKFLQLRLSAWGLVGN